jgi:hypothetical protein
VLCTPSRTTLFITRIFCAITRNFFILLGRLCHERGQLQIFGLRDRLGLQDEQKELDFIDLKADLEPYLHLHVQFSAILQYGYSNNFDGFL